MALASSFPRGLDTIFGGADVLARRSPNSPRTVSYQGSRGRRVDAAVRGYRAVQKATIELAHTAGYYFVEKNTAFAVQLHHCRSASINDSRNAWMAHGDGGGWWRTFCENYNIVHFAGGIPATQMGGWLKKPLRSRST